ncbi:MAG: HAMP domain-containing sensor histidine kinase [Candidatus Heteroscillospira sp.]|jgi:signal transduction histidine kinase
MRSTYFKHFFASAALAVLSFLILGMAFTLLSRNFLLDERRESMEINADEVALAAIAFAENDDLSDWNLRVMITSMAKSTGNEILIANSDGVIALCSDKDLFCPHIGYQLDSQYMNMLSSGRSDGMTNMGGLFSGAHYVVSAPIIDPHSDTTLGYAIVSYDSSRVMETWNTFFAIFLFVSICVLSFTVILTLITTRQQTKPINDMAAAALKFAHGDFSVRIDDTGRDDELGALTASFNLMADSLEKSEQRRQEFISNVSHELKTPMTTISGFADGILDGTIPPEKARPYLETISSETKRLNRMVRRMLELSRLQAEDTESLMKKSFDISEVLMRTLLSLEGKINSRHLDVDVELPEEHFIVRGEGDAITQVVYNLLDNAIKFSKEGTSIGLSLWKQDNKAYVSVKNHGDTIPTDQLNLIFDRFHKTDRSRSMDREGVGLGLYIVKTILNNHNEDISVTSVDGVTEFVFTLTPKKP